MCPKGLESLLVFVPEFQRTVYCSVCVTYGNFPEDFLK